MHRTVVVKQFVNEIDVGQNHSSAAVPMETKLVKSVPGEPKWVYQIQTQHCATQQTSTNFILR